MQRTLKSKLTFTGVGLHSGAPVRMIVHPASAEYGIWFRRSDVTDRDNLIPARWDSAERVPLCTRLVNDDGVSVSTVEHLMAALAGCGIHNALIDIDGPEVPILDGSAAEYVQAILAAGIRDLAEQVRILRILRPVEVRDGDAVARLEPSAMPEMRFDIEFDDAAIGAQSKAMGLANGAFVRELCDSRTFCRQADIENMHANGLALGGSYDNAVVFKDNQVLSPGGLRHSDEPVRHKMLDALGDLALAGAPIIGRYVGVRAGHALTNTLLRALFADPTAYAVETCTPGMAARLPGAGVQRHDLHLAA